MPVMKLRRSRWFTSDRGRQGFAELVHRPELQEDLTAALGQGLQPGVQELTSNPCHEPIPLMA